MQSLFLNKRLNKGKSYIFTEKVNSAKSKYSGKQNKQGIIRIKYEKGYQ